MLKSEFSEKMYEILIDHIFLSQGLDIYVPSQYKESKLGFDALFKNGKIKIGLYQYKIVKEYERIPFRFNVGRRVFKVELHFCKNKINPRKTGYKQHNLLVSKNLKGLNCGYFVPCFISYDDLYKYYHNGVLEKAPQSLVIRPSKFITDNKYHYINFDDNQKCYQFSKDPISIEVETIDRFISSIKESNREFDKEEFISEMLEGIDDSFDMNQNMPSEEKVIRILKDNSICILAYGKK